PRLARAQVEKGRREVGRVQQSGAGLLAETYLQQAVAVARGRHSWCAGLAFHEAQPRLLNKCKAHQIAPYGIRCQSRKRSIRSKTSSRFARLRKPCGSPA